MESPSLFVTAGQIASVLASILTAYYASKIAQMMRENQDHGK